LKRVWTWGDVRPEWRDAQHINCEACGARIGDLCFKNNMSRRRTPHGIRRGKDLDWPGEKHSRISHPFSRGW